LLVFVKHTDTGENKHTVYENSIKQKNLTKTAGLQPLNARKVMHKTAPSSILLRNVHIMRQPARINCTFLS